MGSARNKVVSSHITYFAIYLRLPARPGAERAGPVLPGFCRRDAFGITIGAGVLYLGAIAEGWGCARTQDPSRS